MTKRKNLRRFHSENDDSGKSMYYFAVLGPWSEASSTIGIERVDFLSVPTAAFFGRANNMFILLTTAA